MHKQAPARNLVSGAVIAAMLAVSSWTPAQAAMVTTEQMVGNQAHDADVATVRNFLGRADVRQQMVDWGVSPAEADARVARLRDAELQRLATNIDQQPVGGDFLVVLGVIFLILVVLELVGVTHIFSAF